MNFRQLSEPPSQLRHYYESIAFAQMDLNAGLSSENAFIGTLNLIFNLAWSDKHGFIQGKI